MRNEDTIFISFVVLAVLCAGIGAMITSGKNRGAFLGFILGLLLSLIGVVIALLLSAGVPRPPKGMRAVRCARCNTIQNIPESATTCECWQCKLEMRVNPSIL